MRLRDERRHEGDARLEQPPELAEHSQRPLFSRLDDLDGLRHRNNDDEQDDQPNDSEDATQDLQ